MRWRAKVEWKSPSSRTGHVHAIVWVDADTEAEASALAVDAARRGSKDYPPPVPTIGDPYLVGTSEIVRTAGDGEAA